MRGTEPRQVLYARVPPGVHAELERRVGSDDGQTLSGVAARVLERGLRFDENALMALLGWCWRMAGYMQGRDDETVAATGESFEQAIRRAEIALGVRKAG